ncbi:hypothetical protein KI387_036135 [Taxus chinensis]|uniref:Uncharacterized protein n=1 Tax=Taxus chinensis TaxID=29808 RepID=A0AA38KS00_TAXCH|nr:hypothetical protein KI387_036135 [Taxus chinensis]
MKNPGVTASLSVEEREGDEGRQEERGTNTIVDDSMREGGAGLDDEVQVETMRHTQIKTSDAPPILGITPNFVHRDEKKRIRFYDGVLSVANNRQRRR